MTRWEKYLQYLKDWADSHKDPGFAGCCPVCYAEWCEYEGKDIPDDDCFGVVRWYNEDIENALEENDYEVTAENVSKIRNLLEHHSFSDHMIGSGWDFINTTIFENLDQHHRVCSMCNENITEGFTDECEYWCKDCFEFHMNNTYGKGKWRATEAENILGGFYEYLDTDNAWHPLGIYWTEW